MAGKVQPWGATLAESKSLFVSVKTVGQRRGASTPAERVQRSWVLEQELNKLNPHPRPRGFVFKARTWEDWKKWRAAQTNPRLW